MRCSGIHPLSPVPRSWSHRSAKTIDEFALIQTVCFRGSLIWFLVWCKNTHHDIGPSDKKIRRLQVQPDAAGGEFFILSEFTIESIQISIHQSSNAPILQKSARFASSDPAPPSWFFGNQALFFAKYAGDRAGLGTKKGAWQLPRANGCHTLLNGYAIASTPCAAVMQ